MNTCILFRPTNEINSEDIRSSIVDDTLVKKVFFIRKLCFNEITVRSLDINLWMASLLAAKSGARVSHRFVASTRRPLKRKFIYAWVSCNRIAHTIYCASKLFYFIFSRATFSYWKSMKRYSPSMPMSNLISSALVIQYMAGLMFLCDAVDALSMASLFSARAHT